MPSYPKRSRHLTRPVPRAAVPALLLVLALLLSLALAACEHSSEIPSYDNPFDPDAPTGGDALALSARVSGGDISLTWQQPQGYGIVEYVIQHSYDPDSGYDDPILVEHTAAATNVYLYTNAEPTTSHWFRIQAVTADGDFTLVSYTQPAGATPGPRVILGSGSGRTATRYVQARVAVTQGATLSVRLSPDFDQETLHPAAAEGDTATFTIDLGEAAQDSSFTVRVISFADGYTSPATDTAVKVDFTPDVTLQGGGTKVGARTPTLVVPVTGVTAMRFALTAEDLAAAAWEAPAPLYSGIQLTTATTAQDVWYEFEGDLGFVSPAARLTLTPDLLGSAAFRLVLPQDHVTDESVVEAVFTGARATLMRVALDADLAAAPWQAFEDTFTIDLGPEAGQKTLYAQARNEWADSAVLTDYAIHVAQGVEIAFLAPAAGMSLDGGVPLLVRGRASAGAADLDSVKIDLGDGDGFQPVEGSLEDWSATWNVPVVEAATAHVLRARAWSSAGVPAVVDSATATVSVTINP
jgi:hypothetical protein